MKTAKFIRSIPEFRGDARLYRVEPPMKCDDADDEKTDETSFVIVSGVYAMFTGPETYIFAATENDPRPTSWAELDGSFRGAIDHEAALRYAGYEIVQ